MISPVKNPSFYKCLLHKISRQQQNASNSLFACPTCPRTICNWPIISHSRQPFRRFPHLKLNTLWRLLYFHIHQIPHKTIKYGKLVILGRIKRTNVLCNIPIAYKTSTSSTPLEHLDHTSLSSQNTKADFADFLHGSAFSPIKSILIQGIKSNHFAYWNGLTESLITKHLPKSIATRKFHLRLQHKKIKWTNLEDSGISTLTSLHISSQQ